MPPTGGVAFYLPSVTSLLDGSSSQAAGGAETQVMLLARALASRGVRSCLVAYPGRRPLPRSIAGVQIVEREVSKGHQRIVGKVREGARMLRALRRANASVVVGRTASVSTGLVALVAKLLRRRFVYSAASMLDFDFDEERLGARGLRTYRLVFRLADHIVVQTDEQAQRCREVVGRDALVIRSIAPQVPSRTAEPEAFAWIGRVYPNKQPLVFTRLAAAVPEAQFRMVAVPSPGSGELLAEVRAAASTLGNLDVLPPMSPADVGDLIERAVAVISTSEFEGMPNVFLEAWSRGVPVVAFSHDPDEVITRFGLGESCDSDFDLLVDAARRRWENRLAATAEAERCRRYAKDEHAPDAVAAKWQSLLESLVSRPPVGQS